MTNAEGEGRSDKVDRSGLISWPRACDFEVKHADASLDPDRGTSCSKSAGYPLDLLVPRFSSTREECDAVRPRGTPLAFTANHRATWPGLIQEQGGMRVHVDTLQRLLAWRISWQTWRFVEEGK